MQSNFQTQAPVDHIVTNIPVVPPFCTKETIVESSRRFSVAGDIG